MGVSGSRSKLGQKYINSCTFDLLSETPQNLLSDLLLTPPPKKTSTKPLKHYKIRGLEGFVEVFLPPPKNLYKTLQTPYFIVF